MPTRMIIVFAIAAILVTNLQCAQPSVLSRGQGAPAAGKRDAVVTEGEGRLGIARLPEPFVIAGSRGAATVITAGFEIRILSDADPGELLLAGRDYDKAYSDNIYAVSLDGKFRVRQVTRQDWERAGTPKPGGEHVSAIEADPERPNTFVVSKKPAINYRGKSFARTGAAWTSNGALASPDGKWIAVFSHTTERETTGGALPGLGQGGKGEGEMFVDVYDTSSGKKVMAGHAPHSGGQYPDYDFDEAVWVENRCIIVPLSYLARGSAYFLGVLPVE